MSTPVEQSDGKQAESLCLACGLCCNGVLFADVKLQPQDDPAELRALGVNLVGQKLSARGLQPAALQLDSTASIKSHPAPFKFTQPCSAYRNCQCQIYAERPQHCRSFDCLLLKSVKAGTTSHRHALATIKTTRQQVATVKRLLGELGNHEEHLALAGRVRRTARRLEKSPPDVRMAELFGRLTLAVHDLNLLLSQAFYP